MQANIKQVNSFIVTTNALNPRYFLGSEFYMKIILPECYIYTSEVK